MKRKTILNPLCSDLVVSLDGVVNSDEDFKEVLAEVEKITGWKLGVEVGILATSDNTKILIPVKAEDVEIINSMPAVHKKNLPLELVLQYWTEMKNEGRWSDELDEKHLPISLIPVNTVCQVHFTKMVDSIGIYNKCGYCGRGPIIRASQHCYDPHFEPLALVARRYSATWHVEDGGSSEDFEKWCKENGYEDVAGLGPD